MLSLLISNIDVLMRIACVLLRRIVGSDAETVRDTMSQLET